IEKLTADLKHRRERISLMEEDQLDKDEKYLEDLKNLKEQIVEKDSHIVRLKRNSQVFEEQVDTTERDYLGKIETKNVYIQSLEAKLKAVNREIDNMKQDLDNLQNELDKLEQETAEMMQIKKSMLTTIEVMTEENKVLSSEVGNLKNENINLKSINLTSEIISAQNYGEQKKELTTNNETISKLKEKIDKLEAKGLEEAKSMHKAIVSMEDRLYQKLLDALYKAKPNQRATEVINNCTEFNDHCPDPCESGNVEDLDRNSTKKSEGLFFQR
ncbi:hypothetical protein HHI36_003770, partial [Cryptolaemus montrouzieri]